MAFALRILLFIALGTGLSSIGQARWYEARSPNFVVYSDGGEAELRRSMTLLEDYDGFLRMVTGTVAPPSPSPLRIYLVSSNAKLRAIRDVPAGVLGFYAARVGGTAAFAVRGDKPGMGGEEVLMHEYAHHFATRYYPAYYPGWYREGFAEFVMTARFEPDRIEIGRYNPARAATLVRGTWLPLEKILSGNLGKLSPAQTNQYYAQSWLIVHYLFAVQTRRDALTRYLAALHSGVAEPTAFQTAFGIDHAAFEADLKRYMNGRIAYGTIGRTAAPAGEIALRIMPASADDLILPHAALMLGIAEPQREAATIATIRAEAARHAGDAYAQRVLARAEISSGDRAAGVAMIDQLLVAAPNDAELLYVRGVADFYAGRTDAARRAELFASARPWFARAVAADPGYYTALYRLAQCTPGGLQSATDETSAQLVKAHELAPLVGDIAVDAATALMARNRYADAAGVLAPIASNPHGGNSGQAQALFDRALAGAAAGAQ